MKTMLVYGNRQAAAIAAVLDANPLVSELVRVRFAPGNGFLGRDAAADAAILCLQYPRRLPRGTRVPKKCFTVTFPALDSNLLWPFLCENPYNAPAPGLPFGPFPYGDCVILDAVGKDMALDDILDYYIGGWNEYGIDLDRFRSLEVARMTERDSQCGVKISDYTLRNFARRKLFSAVDHPTTVLFEELVERLLGVCGAVEPRFVDADVRSTLETRFGSRVPLENVDTPIHPKVAEFFQLEWYDPNQKFHGFDGIEYSYTDYYAAMIRHAFANKGRRP